MLILAIEQSSDLGSIALLNDEKIIGEKEWNALTERSGGLFTTLKKLLAELSAQMGDIETYAIDVGPGSYSGLRASMAAARAFALPQKQKIYALTSAETMAFEIMKENSAPFVQVVGDARRGQWWTCVYQLNGNIPIIHSKLCLVAENNFYPVAGALLVSADWHRLKDKLMVMAIKGAVVEAPCMPKAAVLGQLACRKICAHIPSEPLNPIYLHAAVNVKPETINSEP